MSTASSIQGLPDFTCGMGETFTYDDDSPESTFYVIRNFEFPSQTAAAAQQYTKINDPQSI